jgi:predicted nucleic acid-binding protein
MIKGRDLHGLADSSTLDLAFYEIGNAILQETKMGILDQQASIALLEVLESLPDIMNVVSFNGLSPGEVLQTAKQLARTFYDASYATLSKNKGEVLVTDDGALAKAASKIGIRTYSAATRP